MTAVIDRVVQYPNRFKLTDVSTGTVLGTFDLDAVTGTISVVGTKINKALFDSIASDIEARVKTSGGDVSQTSETFTASSVRNNLTSGETISVSMGKIYKWLNDLKALAFKDSLGKADVGLGNIDNTTDKDKPISTATQTALDKKQDTLVSGTNIKTIEGNSILGSGNIDLDKSAVGLGNVDNTSDANKPISTAQQAALDLKMDKSSAATQANLNTEIQARKDADTTLQTNIDNEAKARSNADTTERSTAKDEYIKNMLHLGYYDTYTIDSNGNYAVTRQTGYIRFAAETATDLGFFKQTYSNITRSVKDTTWTELISNADSSSDIGNTTPTKNGCFLSGGWIYVYAKNNDFSGLVIYIQGKTSDSYTETYEPNHFARIEPYALEYAKSEADRSANLMHFLFTASGHNMVISDNLGTSVYTFIVGSTNDPYVETGNIQLKANTRYSVSATNGAIGEWIDDAFYRLSTFTTGSTGIIRFRLTASVSATGTYTSYIMLNEGSHALPYQPCEGKAIHAYWHLTRIVDITADIMKKVIRGYYDRGGGYRHDIIFSGSAGNGYYIYNGTLTQVPLEEEAVYLYY